jgi:hypothetical protein
MADYNKQTVAQLRQLLKDREIPSTGLTRKAQIVEKLEEADKAGVEDPAEKSDAPAPAEGRTSEEPSTVDAPLDPVEQVQEERSEDVVEKPDAPGPALAEAGGTSTMIVDPARKAN